MSDLKFQQDDGLLEGKPIECVRLKLRDMRPVKLVGMNSGLKAQIVKNRQWRMALGTKTHCILWIECEAADTVMLLDSRAIMVTYFCPRTEAEKVAIRESEMALYEARINERDGLLDEGMENRAYAEEMLWLAVCGLDDATLILPKTRKYGLPSRGGHGEEVIATWNQYEPVIGLSPYENL